MYKLDVNQFNRTMAALVAASKCIESMREAETFAGIMIDAQIRKLAKIGENAPLDEDTFNGIMGALVTGSKVMEMAEDHRLQYVGICIDRAIDELEVMAAPCEKVVESTQ
jgi:hypothetical protein